MIEYLKSIIPDLKLQKNKRAYVGGYCPFCGETSRNGKAIRYVPKLKILKAFCCGFSTKTLQGCKKGFKYPFYLKEKRLANRMERLKNLTSDDDLPF